MLLAESLLLLNIEFDYKPNVFFRFLKSPACALSGGREATQRERRKRALHHTANSAFHMRCCSFVTPRKELRIGELSLLTLITELAAEVARLLGVAVVRSLANDQEIVAAAEEEELSAAAGVVPMLFHLPTGEVAAAVLLAR